MQKEIVSRKELLFLQTKIMMKSMNIHINLTKPLAAAILALAVLLFMAGCTSSPLGRLGGVDSLINTRPDSALTLLNALLPDTNAMSERDLMRFHLLRTNAQNKCDTVFTARHASLMRRVCYYYDRHSSPQLPLAFWRGVRGEAEGANSRMLAHYLLGRCYSDMGEAPAALQEFHNAADAADTTRTDCDYHQLSLVYSQAGSIFNKLYMPASELQELRQASRYALLGNDSLSFVIYEDLLANCYAHLHMPDSFIRTKEKCSRLFMKMGYKDYAAMSLGSTVHTLLQKGETDMAKKNLDYYEEYSGLFLADGSISHGHETYYYTKGLYFMHVGNPDSAEVYFRKELNEGATSNDRLCAYQGLCLVYRQANKMDSVAKYAQSSYSLSDSIYEKTISRNLQRMQSMHDYSRQAKLAEEQSRIAYAAKQRSILLAVIIAITVFILIMVWRKHKRDMNLKEAEMNRALLEYSMHKAELTKKKEELQCLLKAEKEIRLQTELLLNAQTDEMTRLGKANEELSGKLVQSKNHTTSLQLIITRKSEELETLRLKVKDFETLYEHEEPNQQGVQEIIHTNTYAVFEGYVKTRRIEPGMEDWQSLQAQIENHYPKFKRLLKIKHRVNTYDYRVCMLIVIGFSPGEIASIMNKESASISKTRKKLLRNVFHIEGKPEQFDQTLRESI